MLSVTRAWIVSWNVRTSFPFSFSWSDQIRTQCCGSASLLFIFLSVSLHLSLSHVENLREIAVDARAITCPPVPRSFFDENNYIYGYSLRILSTSFSRDVCEWYVNCVLIVLPDWHCSSFSEGGKEWQAELSSIANKVRLFMWYYNFNDIIIPILNDSYYSYYGYIWLVFNYVRKIAFEKLHSKTCVRKIAS